jgi:hypothetical protein
MHGQDLLGRVWGWEMLAPCYGGSEWIPYKKYLKQYYRRNRPESVAQALQDEKSGDSNVLTPSFICSIPFPFGLILFFFFLLFCFGLSLNGNEFYAYSWLNEQETYAAGNGIGDGSAASYGAGNGIRDGAYLVPFVSSVTSCL